MLRVQVHQFHLAVGIGLLEDLLEVAAHGVLRYVQSLRQRGDSVCYNSRLHYPFVRCAE
jgi:hypothetical protein